MARMLPRRLGHDEEASLVEHLTELRHRLFICLGSLIPAFALAYAFHDDLIDRLKDLLPAGTPLVTFGVTEPFITSLKVSFYAAIALVLPIILWQVWAFLAPAVREDTQRVLAAFVVLSTALFILGPDSALAWAAVHPEVGVLVLERSPARARWSASLAGRVTPHPPFTPSGDH